MPPAHAPGEPTRIGVAGIHGHGATHVAEALRLERAGRARLVAVADHRAPDVAVGDAALFADAAAMIADADLDVVVLSTPIHTHVPLARAALAGGAHVLLEKPPAPSLVELEELAAAARAAERAVQVGFQSLGSAGVDAVRALAAGGAVGEVRAYGALGTWVRAVDYWTRSDWAGRRELDGVPVVDGAVTNPLAHAVATALAVAGATGAEDIASVELDLLRANDIDADDTSSLVVRLADGRSLAGALALTASRRSEPCVTVEGELGRIVFWYTLDVVQVVRPGEPFPETTRHERRSLLENLVDHAVDGAELLVPLAATGAFTRVLDAVRTGADARPIASEHVERVRDGDGEHLVVRGLEHWAARVVAEQSTFSGVGAPFAG
ncbi:Gfo/Idh/MocA family oxidoreductase [Agromyces sp. SYSU T00194]|uniref:Gfo/Idh/MocA family oxidoreductase n=1 Tax=Agromyces chitinivorans TaxID=3158560 RepID=UPI0033980B9D